MPSFADADFGAFQFIFNHFNWFFIRISDRLYLSSCLSSIFVFFQGLWNIERSFGSPSYSPNQNLKFCKQISVAQFQTGIFNKKYAINIWWFYRFDDVVIFVYWSTYAFFIRNFFYLLRYEPFLLASNWFFVIAQ